MSPSPASCTMCEIWCVFRAVLLPLSCPRIQDWSQVRGSPGEKADGCMWPGKSCPHVGVRSQHVRAAMGAREIMQISSEGQSLRYVGS